MLSTEGFEVGSLLKTLHLDTNLLIHNYTVFTVGILLKTAVWLSQVW